MLLGFRSLKVAKWGTVENNLVTTVEPFASHRELMDAFWDDPTSLQLEQSCVPLEALNLLSPVTADVQIFCQGLNYASHKEEGGVKTGKENLIFTKPPPLSAAQMMTSSDLPTASYLTTKLSWLWY